MRRLLRFPAASDIRTSLGAWGCGRGWDGEPGAAAGRAGGRATPTRARARRLGPGRVTSSRGAQRTGGGGSQEAPGGGGGRRGSEAKIGRAEAGGEGENGLQHDLSRKNLAAGASPPFKRGPRHPPHPRPGRVLGNRGRPLAAARRPRPPPSPAAPLTASLLP